MSVTSPWPSPSEYSSAIQNPKNCFSEPELQTSMAVANHLGLPAPASGNFAVVYQLNGAHGTSAVRCFIRPVTDQQDRYQALSTHLRSFWLPSLVDFKYLEQGIRVRGQWYPVVQMAWVPGLQMHR